MAGHSASHTAREKCATHTQGGACAAGGSWLAGFEPASACCSYLYYLYLDSSS